MLHITADAPLWVVSRVMISSRCDELIHCWERATKSFSPDDIHDLRVASRRLREAVTLFAPCYPAKEFSRMKAEIKQLTNLLGTMRNTDEALLFFTQLLTYLPEPLAPSLAAYLEGLRNKRIKEHRHLENQLNKLDLVLVRYEIRRALKRPSLFKSTSKAAFIPIGQFFSIKLLERESTLKQLLPDSLCEQNINALHRLRIALKKFRYAFELTAPIVKNGFKEFSAQLKNYQEVLGKIHDLDVFLELIREQDFDPECSDHLTKLLSSRRSELYANYLTMHGTLPVDRLGESALELL